jgi:peptide/nickel transport system permease protein
MRGHIPEVTDTQEELAEKRRGRLIGEFWYRFGGNRAGVAGLALVASFCVIALLAPWIAPFGQMDSSAGPALSPPTSRNILGTDDLGRDILSAIIYGARPSLLVGILSAGIAAILGTVVGIVSGYYGGSIDDILMRFTEMVMTIPIFVLAVIIVTFFGSSMPFVVMTIALLIWPGTARVTRSETMRIEKMEFVNVARSFGASTREIITGELLPNIVGPIVVTWTLCVGFSILMAAGLSFIGLGDINYPDWGYMLQRSMAFINRAWWMSVFPGISIFLVVLAFNLIGDAISDAFSPKAITGEK